MKKVVGSSFVEIPRLWDMAVIEMGHEYVGSNPSRFCQDFARLYGLTLAESNDAFTFTFPKEFGKRTSVAKVYSNRDRVSKLMLGSWNSDFMERSRSMNKFLAEPILSAVLA